MSRYVGTIDQGTTSTRFMVFDEGARQKAVERSLGWLDQPHLNGQSDPAV